MIPTNLRTLLTSLISLTLLACSSGSDSGSDNSPNTTFTKFGILEIVDPEANNTLDISAVFFETDKPIPLSNVTAINITPNIDADHCDLEISDSSSSDTINLIDAPDTQVTTISAGDIITISGTFGTAAQLSESATAIGTGYFGDYALAENDSTNLMADIPGSAFPAFSSVTIPDVEPFTLTSESSPTGMEIDAALMWTASASPESHIILYTDLTRSSLTSGEGEAIQHIVLDCLLVDDGSFELPQGIQSQLSEAGVNTLPMNIGREAVNVVQQDGTVLVVTRSSGDL